MIVKDAMNNYGGRHEMEIIENKMKIIEGRIYL